MIFSEGHDPKQYNTLRVLKLGNEVISDLCSVVGSVVDEVC
jgi:hypothetical protein